MTTGTMMIGHTHQQIEITRAELNDLNTLLVVWSDSGQMDDEGVAMLENTELLLDKLFALLSTAP